ncbi:YigZ family protein [Methyloprofundus sp.]|uniref:YigZ family protein n=1 Tax=Methyloprofundus sp. TaxID=2020875 RepID=UPI003D10D960
MQCIKVPALVEENIKKSRFIGLIYPCSGEADAVAYLKALRSEHASANHIAFAYRIKTEKGLVCRFHDAGEPSGTAGKPIFKYIEGHDLINVLCVVVLLLWRGQIRSRRPNARLWKYSKASH